VDAKPTAGVGKKWSWLTLFASTTTLICCALPILLVTLGLGAVSAALFANVPFLTFLAMNKIWLFLFSFCMLAIGFWSVYRSGRTCPIDPELAAQCAKADKWNKRVLIFSASMWAVGFTAAYLSVPLLNLFSG
jgi:mercuric ion transport protein